MTREEDGVSELGRRLAMLQDIVPREALGLADPDAQKLITLPVAQRSRPRRRWWVGVTLIGLIFIGFAVWHLVTRDSLVLSVKDQRLVNERRVWIAADQGPVQLRASDGSVLRFGFGARARVETAQTSEPMVAVEQGLLEAELAATKDVQWQILTGPYTLTAHGTSFSLDWNASTLELRIDARTGSIKVQAPELPMLSEVNGGQRLRIFTRERRFTLTSAEN
jgi:hypothetical protein